MPGACRVNFTNTGSNQQRFTSIAVSEWNDMVSHDMTYLKVMLAEHSGRFTAIGHETTGLVVVLPHVVFEGTPSVLGGSHLQNLSLHASNNQLRVYKFHKRQVLLLRGSEPVMSFEMRSGVKPFVTPKNHHDIDYETETYDSAHQSLLPEQ